MQRKTIFFLLFDILDAIFAGMETRVPNTIQEISADLRRKVVSGAIKVGDLLPTMRGLAKEYQCSIAMVSKALLILINEGLVEQRKGMGSRVINASLDRHLSQNQLDAFAFIYPSKKHEGIWRTVKGFEDEASHHQQRVVLLSTGSDYSKEAEFLSRLSEFDVKGAVIYPVIPSRRDQIQISKILVESKFPIVLADLSLPGLGCPSVVVDGFHAGYVVTRYLANQGVKRIGFLSNHSWSPSVADRYHGYLWALEEAGIPEAKERVMLESTMRPDYEDPLREPTALARLYLGRGDVADGVVCGNDFLARGLIRAARESGKSIPGDLKVVGIDDFSMHDEGHVALTTYNVPFEEIGRKAFHVLHSILNGEPPEELENRVRGEIVVRRSA